MTESEVPKPQPAQDCLEVLRERFPVVREARPLAVGIHKAIKAQCPELADDDLRKAMKRHTQTTRYLKALVTDPHRYDLNGVVAGDVSDEHRQIAEMALTDRLAKIAARRKLEAETRQQEQKRSRLPPKGRSAEATTHGSHSSPQASVAEKRPAQKPRPSKRAKAVSDTTSPAPCDPPAQKSPDATPANDKLAQLLAHFNKSH